MGCGILCVRVGKVHDKIIVLRKNFVYDKKLCGALRYGNGARIEYGAKKNRIRIDVSIFGINCFRDAGRT